MPCGLRFDLSINVEVHVLRLVLAKGAGCSWQAMGRASNSCCTTRPQLGLAVCQVAAIVPGEEGKVCAGRSLLAEQLALARVIHEPRILARHVARRVRLALGVAGDHLAVAVGARRRRTAFGREGVECGLAELLALACRAHVDCVLGVVRVPEAVDGLCAIHLVHKCVELGVALHLAHLGAARVEGVLVVRSVPKVVDRQRAYNLVLERIELDPLLLFAVPGLAEVERVLLVLPVPERVDRLEGYRLLPVGDRGRGRRRRERCCGGHRHPGGGQHIGHLGGARLRGRREVVTRPVPPHLKVRGHLHIVADGVQGACRADLDILTEVTLQGDLA
mmetsp:Transcript_47106/g.121773  ORF Transcript_47106/g.121773 Transcript_47106/m.121773 type:complete len:333 (-) Transcript_47106:1187-2185(-)